MALIWLVLIGLIGFAYNLNWRLRRLEDRFDLLPGAAYDFAPNWHEPDYRAPTEEAALAPATTEETRQPAAVARAELTQAEIAETLESPSVDSVEFDEPAERHRWNLSISFEDLFGRRLPIWAGGITLAVAGMLIVKLSIDSGLLSPPVRVVAGLIFGAALIVSAELALRFEERVRDSRVRQALAGAGVASLYASVLVAVNLYHLINPLTAMLGMAAVTALAMFLATRFGAPSAMLGLAGGLAAPALVSSTEPNVPLLSVYLALAVSGLCALSRNQRWMWLGISALVGGFGWGIVLLLSSVVDTTGSISVGLYLLLLGVGIPALGFAGERKNQLQLVAGVVAAAQMTALVATGGFAMLNWGLFGLLSVATVWLAQREHALIRLPSIGLLTALLLMFAWTSPTVTDFAIVMSGCGLIYGGPAIWRLWRSGGIVEAAEITVLGLGALLIPMYHFHHGSNDHTFGLLALGLSAGVGACAALGWKHAERRNDERFALLSIVTATLLAGAALLLLQVWAAAIAIALIGLGLLHLGQIAGDKRLEPFAWIFGIAGLFTYRYSQLLFGKPDPHWMSALRWSAQAGIAAMFAWRAGFGKCRAFAQFLVPVLLYVAVASLVSDRVEPLIAPVLLVAVAFVGRGLGQRLIPAMTASALIMVGGALDPLMRWSNGALESLIGEPMMFGDVPPLLGVTTKLLIPAAAIVAARMIAAGQLRLRERIAGWSICGVLAIVGVHSLYKHVFAIGTLAAFTRLGLTERTVWEFALAGLALLAYRLRKPVPALVLAVAAASHEAFYTLILHNPLWASQSVGAWSVINLILPVYALAIALAIAGERAVKPTSSEAAHGLAVTQMALIVLFAFTELRQLFHGAFLSQPGVLIAEDILRSILAIALAIGFLLWGIRKQQRGWRIASLVLMLAAVGKVFLFDASGLQGVTRIASFVALGLSLIGIGWLYSRHLGSDKAKAVAF